MLAAFGTTAASCSPVTDLGTRTQVLAAEASVWAMSQGGSLYLVSITSGGKERVTLRNVDGTAELVAEVDDLCSAAMAPDGSKVYLSDCATVFRWDRATKARTTISTLDYLQQAVFVGGVQSANGRWTVLGPSAEGDTRLLDTITGTTKAVSGNEVCGISNDATRVAISDSDLRITVRNTADGTRVAGSVTTPTSKFANPCQGSPLSGDGKLLAFQSTAPSLPGPTPPYGQMDLFTMEVATGKFTRVAADVSIGIWLSNDSRYLTFFSNPGLMANGGGGGDVYRLDRTSGAIRRITGPGDLGGWVIAGSATKAFFDRGYLVKGVVRWEA